MGIFRSPEDVVITFARLRKTFLLQSLHKRSLKLIGTRYHLHFLHQSGEHSSLRSHVCCGWPSRKHRYILSALGLALPFQIEGAF